MILSVSVSPTLTYVYDLGSAHNREVFGSVETFAESLMNALMLYPDTAICCWTNSGQSRERGYLNIIGFESTAFPNTRMQFHSITREKWDEFSKDIKKKVEEARKKEEEIIAKWWADYHEAEELEGRKPDEIRVGDLIIYVSNNDKNVRRSGSSNARAAGWAIYYIDEVLPSGNVRFRITRPNDEPYGNVFVNYDSLDRGYPQRNCVRIESDWRKVLARKENAA